MKIIYGIVSAIGLIILVSCETQQKKEERLAKLYCASCHSFPDPSLLDKETWKKGVLPQMAFRMGHDYTLINSISKADQEEALKAIPNDPMLSDEEWEAIRNYYLTNAPDSLVVTARNITKVIDQFEATPFKLPSNAHPLITLISHDTINNKIYLGNRYASLYQFNENFLLKDSFQLSSPPSHMIFRKNEDPLLLLMGIMDPNDQFKGELTQLKLSDRTLRPLIDSVKRPVHFEEVDLNKDNLKDYIICEFGNYTGVLTAYESLGHGKFEKHFLQIIPGARKVIVKDFDKDGSMDIICLARCASGHDGHTKTLGRRTCKCPRRKQRRRQQRSP